MSGKNTKQIRKVAKEQMSNMFTQTVVMVLAKMETKARSASFGTRLKLAMKYLFHKDVSGMLEL